jgi:Sap, sulfolipid-1-addressing protein
MWTTVLVMAIAVIFEPIRIGLAVLMLNRRRPMLQLLTFISGGFTMGIGVGLVIIFILRSTPLAGHFTVAQAQIVAGSLALLVALALATSAPARRFIRRAPACVAVGGDEGPQVPGVVQGDVQGDAALDETPPGRLKRLTEGARQLLMEGDSLHVAFVSGMGAALPSANYLGAMAAILAANVAPPTQATALLLFNVVAFGLVEVPLVSYLAAPQKTREFMAGVQEWIRARGQRGIAVVLAAGGTFLLILGFSNSL